MHTQGSVGFDCEGCGLHVLAFGIEKPPVHGFCAQCAWMCEFVPDPEEMMEMRRHAAGWEQPVRPEVRAREGRP